MTRQALFVFALLSACAFFVTVAGGADSLPPKPVVVGPRLATTATPTYRFIVRMHGVPRERLRFRCAFDSRRLHSCQAVYSERLTEGMHVLRVRAVNRAGRQGPEMRVEVRVRLAPEIPQAPAFKVGSQPIDVTTGGGALWVTNLGDGTVSRVDPGTGSVLATIEVGGGPSGVAFGDAAVWVGDFEGGRVSRINAVTGAVTTRVPTGGQPTGLAVAPDGSIWAANFDGSVSRIDPATSEVVGRTALPAPATAVAIGFGLVWCTLGDGSVAALDPATARLVATPTPVGRDADGIVVTSDAVWVSTFGGSAVRLDPATRRVVSTVLLAGAANGIAAAAGAVWASVGQADGTVVRINPASGKIIGRVRVGRRPRGLVEAAGSLWVVNELSGTVSRIALG